MERKEIKKKERNSRKKRKGKIKQEEGKDDCWQEKRG
jgi:hypothetical protein